MSRPVILAALLAAATLAFVPHAATAEEPSEAAAASAVQGTPEAAEAREFQPPPGYRKMTRAGEVVYCRDRAPVGTRLKTRECRTQAELVELERTMKALQEDVQQRSRMCRAGAMCSGG